MTGVLRLTDSAQMHLPTLGVPPDRNRAMGWLEEITILQLATHTADSEKRGWVRCSGLPAPDDVALLGRRRELARGCAHAGIRRGSEHAAVLARVVDHRNVGAKTRRHNH